MLIVICLPLCSLQNSYAIKKKDEIERVAKVSRTAQCEVEWWQRLSAPVAHFILLVPFVLRPTDKRFARFPFRCVCLLPMVARARWVIVCPTSIWVASHHR